MRALVQQSLCTLASVGLILIACGCRKAAAPAPTPEAARPVDPQAPPSTQEQALIAQAVAFRQGVAPPAPTLKLRGGELATPQVLEAYNQELARLIFQRRDAPETLDELVRRWPMPRLPTPPAGKRIVYDAANRIIRLDPP